MTSTSDLFNAAVAGDVTFFQSVTATGHGIRERFCTGNTVLHTHLGKRKEKARIEFISYVLSESVGDDQLLSAKNEEGDMVYHVAAKCGQVLSMKVLLDAGGPFYLSFPNRHGLTPIHLALMRNLPDVALRFVQVFIKADPRKEFIPRLFDERTLLLAVQTNSQQLVDLVCKVSIFKLSYSQLRAAISPGNSDMVKTMLRINPELTEWRDDEQRTPHHMAAESDDNGILELFLGEHKQGAYRRDSRGQTAAHIAAKHNNVVGLELFKNVAPDSFQIRDNQLRNVAHHAAISEQGWEALGFLFQQDEFCTLLCDEDHQGNTPIHLLALSLQTVGAASLEPLRSVITELGTMNLTATNNDGLTPGDIARSFSLDHLNLDHQAIVQSFKNVAPPSPDIANVKMSRHPDKEDILETSEKEKASVELKKMCVHHSSVAGVLAPPGGFNQNDKDPNRGTAILSDNPAFQVFSICIAVAMASSMVSLAFFSPVIFLVSKLSLPLLKRFSFLGLFFSAVSIGVLVAATVASAYATEQKTGPLLIAKLVIASVSMFIYVLFLICSFLLWTRFSTEKISLSSVDKNC